METEIKEMLRRRAGDVEPAPTLPAATLSRARRRRAMNGLSAVAVTAVIAVAAVSVVARVQREEEPVAPVGPKPKVGAQYGLPGEPTDAAFAFGSVWVATEDAVLRIDPATGTVKARIDSFPAETAPRAPGEATNRIAVGEGAVWVIAMDDGYRVTTGPFATATSTTGDGMSFSTGAQIGITPPPRGFRAHWTVVRIDPATTTTTATPLVYDFIPNGMSVAGGSVWVTSERYTDKGPEGRIYRFDAQTRRQLDLIPLEGRPTSIATEAGSLWVALSLPGSIGRVARFDVERKTVVASLAISKPGDVVLRGDEVWVASLGPDAWSVERLDKLSLLPHASIRIGDPPEGFSEIMAGSRDVWIVSSVEFATAKAFLRRVDPDADRVVTATEVWPFPRHIADGGEVLWIVGGATGDAKLWRIDLPAELR